VGQFVGQGDELHLLHVDDVDDDVGGPQFLHGRRHQRRH
jgi:hypothetical protein